MNELISIVIPVYNGSQFIARCVSSLRSQTYTNFEAIFVDDASTDDSYERLSEYAAGEDRFDVLRNEVNSRQAVSRNRGIARARGEFLFFLDVDDWLAPDALERLHGIWEKGRPDMVIGGVRLYDTAADSYSEPHYSGYFPRDISCRKAEDIPDIYHNAAMCNKLITREFFDRHGLSFDESLVRFEDTNLSDKVYLANPTVSLTRQYTYYYAQHPGDLVDRSNRKHGGPDYAAYYRLVLLEKLYDHLIEKGLQGHPCFLMRFSWLQTGLIMMAGENFDPELRQKSLSLVSRLGEKLPLDFVLNIPYARQRFVLSLIKSHQVGFSPELVASFDLVNTDLRKIEERTKAVIHRNKSISLFFKIARYLYEKSPASIKNRIQSALR